MNAYFLLKTSVLLVLTLSPVIQLLCSAYQLTTIFRYPLNNHRRAIQVRSSSEQLENVNTPSIFIFGLGYVGCEVARALRERGWQVSGTCTNVNKISTLRTQGIDAFLFDDLTGPLIEERALQLLSQSSHILTTIPPNIETGTDSVLTFHGNDIRRASLGSQLKWIGYLSSTGIYGDYYGAWVTESSEIRPNNKKTIARAKADNTWALLHSRNGLPVHIFRLAGIYGPGRSALNTLEKAEGDMLKCNPDDKNMISRIHIADIVSFLMVSIYQPLPGLKVNLADDLPSTRYDVCD